MGERPPSSHRGPAEPNERVARERTRKTVQELAATLLTIAERELSNDPRSISQALLDVRRRIQTATRPADGPFGNATPEQRAYLSDLDESIRRACRRLDQASIDVRAATRDLPALSLEEFLQIGRGIDAMTHGDDD